MLDRFHDEVWAPGRWPEPFTGPGDRLNRARDEHELYFRSHPHDTDREYLLSVFNDLAKRPGTKATQKGKKPGNQSSIGDPAFAAGYRGAYDTIYERNDYAAAIAQLKSLGHDDHPNVANLIGYSYRKLGDYEQSQVWYERALQADPNHVLTWQYYGLWQLERGNREQALYHLGRIASICGTDCEEYRSLAAALDKPTGTALVY